MAKNKTTKFFEAMSKTKPASEKQIREAVRRLVVKMLREQEEEEEEETAEEDPTAAPTPMPPTPETKPKPEPQAQPEPTPEEEEGLNADFQAATDMFIRKLTQSTGTPAAEDLVDMISQLIERFTTTSEERLNLLKGIRNNTVH